MKILDLKQNTPEWELFRQSIVGASDIGTLMEGSEREVYELMQEKRGLSRRYTNDAMRHGTLMEPEAIAWLVGHAIRGAEKVCALMDAPEDWLMASFDHIDQDQKYLAEIKCPKHVFDTQQEHSYYKRWWWQVQAQLAVSGYKRGILLVYSDAKQTQEWIERDDAAISKLLERGRWFHNLLVNFEDLPIPNELVQRYDNEAEEWASCFRELDAKIKALEEEKKVLRDEGIALAADTPFVCAGVKVVRTACRETVDYEAACRAHGIDLTPYVKKPKSPFIWRISAS